MKKSLKYEVLNDTMYQTPDGLMAVRTQHVVFTKQVKGGDIIRHHARIVTHVNEHKHKLIALLTNDMESDPDVIISICRQRWDNPEKDWEMMLDNASEAPPEPSLFD